MITIALSKGRLADSAIELLEAAGYNCAAARQQTRKLILEDKEAGLRFIMAKPADVPTYVEYGAADIGVVGKRQSRMGAGKDVGDVAEGR